MVVTSVYGGGSLELKVSSLGLDSSSRSMTDLKASLTAAISGVTFGANLDAEYEQKMTSGRTMNSILGQSTKTWFGGDQSFHHDQTLGKALE